ncbi:MAG TPA: hypothetical protein DHV02_01640 [Neisseriales bacterium]|jgi:hypothetical protein|nr:hypothetical protein [Neisseriales bacterium]
MTQLQIKTSLPLGIAWTWVKASFAIFREKPINFMFFGIAFVVFSMLPFLGTFLATLVIVRMLLSAQAIVDNQAVGLALNFKSIFSQRNLISYAIFCVGYDLVSMTIMSQFMSNWGVEGATPAMLMDHRVIYLMLGMSLFRTLFFGISLAIATFNPDITVLNSLRLSWKFLYKNIAVITLGLFLLLPFLLVPLYIMVMVTLSMENAFLFGISFLVLVILMLLFLAITTLFSFKLYQDGITHE